VPITNCLAKIKLYYLAPIINHLNIQKMKKILLTAAIILSGMCVSAQDFLVIVGIEKDANDEYSTESLTNNLGFGYMINDKFMGGLTMADATADSTAVAGKENVVQIAAEMQLFARYYHTENLFAQITTPFGSDVEGVSITDLMRLGAGYSVKVWNWVRVEAGYSMLISADVNEDRKGELKLGISMSF